MTGASPADEPGRAGPHDLDRLVSRYLEGAATSEERASLDAHLLGCASCWEEVELARAGRDAVGGVSAPAPEALRDQLRDLVEGESRRSPSAAPPARWAGGRPPGARRSSWGPVAAAAALLAVALVVAVAVVGLGSDDDRQPEVIAAVLDVADADELAGATVAPGVPAPDLGAAGLRLVAGASGVVDDAGLTTYAYVDGRGRELLLHLSPTPFPRPRGARDVAGAGGPWVAGSGGLTLLCTGTAYDQLLVGEDPALVLEAAAVLDVR